MCFSGASLWWLCLASTPKWAHGDSHGVAEYPELLSRLQQWLGAVTSLSCGPAVVAAALWDVQEMPRSQRCLVPAVSTLPEADFGTTLTVQCCRVAPCLHPDGLPLLPKPLVFFVPCAFPSGYFHSGAMAVIKVSPIAVPNSSCWAIAPAFILARRKKQTLNTILHLWLSLSFFVAAEIACNWSGFQDVSGRNGMENHGGVSHGTGSGIVWHLLL